MAKAKKQQAKKRPAAAITPSSEGPAGLTGVTTIPASGSKPVHLCPTVFAHLLAPLDTVTFLREHYQPKKPLVIKGHDFTSMLEEDMEDGDVAALLEASPSETISVWTVAAPGPAQKINTARVQDARSATALWEAGHSVYCRAPENVEKTLVESAVRALGLGFRVEEAGVKQVVEGEVELFLSHKGHTTPFHFDFQENITLQLQGRKRWRLRKGVRNPVRGCAPHYQQVEGILDPAAEEQLKVHRLRDPGFGFRGPKEEEEEEEMVVEVEAGDVFYHPAGMWHAVECLEESISINISLDGMTYADLFAGALKQVLWGEGDGRFGAMVSTGAKPEEAAREMSALLLQASQRFAALAAMPEALLPPCALQSQTMAPLEGNGEEEEEEEEDEEEEEEEEEKEFYASEFPTALGDLEHVQLRRNPLVSLFRLDDTLTEVEEEEEEEEEEAYMVHFAFGGSEDLSSVIRKKVWLPVQLGKFVAGQSSSSSSFSFRPDEAPCEGKGLMRCLGALVHLGVLVVVKGGEEEEEEGKGK